MSEVRQEVQVTWSDEDECFNVRKFEDSSSGLLGWIYPNGSEGFQPFYTVSFDGVNGYAGNELDTQRTLEDAARAIYEQFGSEEIVIVTLSVSEWEAFTKAYELEVAKTSPNN